MYLLRTNVPMLYSILTKSNKWSLALLLVKSLFSSLGAPSVSRISSSAVESPRSSNASLATPRAITTPILPPMTSYGYIWPHNGFLKLSMGYYGPNMASYGFLWLSMDSYGPNMALYHFLWVPMASCDFLWVHMDQKWLHMTSFGFLWPQYGFIWFRLSSYVPKMSFN